MKRADLFEKFTCAVCGGLRTWSGTTCQHCRGDGNSTLRSDVERSLTMAFRDAFDAYPACERDPALALQSAREQAVLELAIYEGRHGCIAGSFNDETLTFECDVHVCEDPDDNDCCKKCCGVGRGGCTCDHDCDKMCLDSCPRWLAARRKERS